MKFIKPTAIALTAAVSIAGAIAVAQAQGPGVPPGPPPAAGSGPGPYGPGWGPGPGPGGMEPAWGMGSGGGPGGMGPGWGMGHGEGMMGPGWGGHRFSKEDRAAFLNARIAAIHAGLALTPDQEKLWPPVESAVRDMAKSMGEAFDKARSTPPKDPIDGMKRRAEWQIARGEALKKVADAAAPLYAALSPEQKERLPALVRPGMRGRIGHWMHDHGMRWGWGRGDDRD